jgi:hypothetical protein
MAFTTSAMLILSFLIYPSHALPPHLESRLAFPLRLRNKMQSYRSLNLRGGQIYHDQEWSKNNKFDIAVDALVVGSGLTGCSHAFHLVHDHNIQSVLLCEKNDQVFFLILFLFFVLFCF